MALVQRAPISARFPVPQLAGRLRRIRSGSALAVLLTALLLPALPASAAEGTIAGTVFKDLDGNAAQGPGDTPLPDQQLYLYDTAGAYHGTTVSDATGRYTFNSLPAGQYEVRYNRSHWRALREDWVPSTTGSVFPIHPVTISGDAVTADFGWRPLVKSTDVAAPISTFVGDNGLRVDSYNDAVTAREIFDAVMQGLVGREASAITVRFGYTANSTTSSTIGAKDGRYTTYKSVAYVSYASWLDTGEYTLVHEYGHAWSLYYAYLTHQDPDLNNYLEARGLAGDERVGTSYEWSPREMIAEDYRQLFGSDSARAGSRLNNQIPDAQNVPGLEAFLRDTFAASPPDPEPTAEPSPSPSPSPSPTPSPTPTPTAEPSPSPSPTASPTPSPEPTTGKGGGGSKSSTGTGTCKAKRC